MAVHELDWLAGGSNPVQFSSGKHPSLEHRLELKLSDQHRNQLADKLMIISGDPAAELKILVSKEWTFFIKLKVGQSRLFSARPNLNEWVATIGLSSNDIQSVVQRMTQIKPSDEFSFNAVCNLNAFSNFELIVSA